MAESTIEKVLGQTGGAMRGPTLDEERERMVPLIKVFRQQIDSLIQQAEKDNSKSLPLMCRAYAPQVEEAHTQMRVHLVGAKMWAGKMLEKLGNPFPKDLADKAE